MPALDLRTAAIELGVAFDLPIKSRAMQNACQDPLTGDWICTQADGADTVATRCSSTGRRLGAARYVGAGHNSQTGLLNEGGVLYHVIDWDSDLVMVPWQSGITRRSDARVKLFARGLDPGYVLVSIAGDAVCFRRKTGTGTDSVQNFTLRSVADVRAGRDRVLGKVGPLPAESPTYQGHCAIGSQLILPTGYGHPDQTQTLTVYDMGTGKKVYATSARVADAKYVVQEPEGFGADRDGYPYLGMTVRAADNIRHWHTYRFTPPPPPKEIPVHPFAAASFYTEMILLEGSTNYLYFDTHTPPLATTGIGNMLDAGGRLSELGLSLPWRTKAGTYATEAQVAAEYSRLSALGIHNQGGAVYAKHASLFLDTPVVEWLFQQTATSMETAIAKQFPGWATMPADAQLAVMSMGWNLGANFPPGWPNLTAALKRGDYLTASDNCLINGRPSERNRRNRILFLQAARTVQYKADPARLVGTGVVLKASTVAASDPAKVNAHAWWTQAMLRATGRYTAALDGLFGPMSKKAFGGPVTLAALTALSRATLNVTITG